MKLSKTERQLLTMALKNHIAEKRETPIWRAAIKTPLPLPPVEKAFSTEGDLPTWLLSTGSMVAIENTIEHRRKEFCDMAREKIHTDLEFNSSAGMGANVFIRLGYLPIFGHPKILRSDAEALVEEWSGLGFDSFCFAKMPGGADLFAEELAENAPMGFRLSDGRPNEAVNVTAVDEKTRESFDTAALRLESAGLAVRVSGTGVLRTWSGLSLTVAGVELAVELSRKPVPAKDAATGIPLHCPNRNENIYQTTSKFDSEKTPIGEMFELTPRYKAEGWTSWTPDARGAALFCERCAFRFTNPKNDFLKPGVLPDRLDK